MKKIMFLLMAVCPMVRADILADGALTFGVDTRQVTVSTSPTNSTQIFTNDPYITSSFITNYSSYTLFISSVPVISTATAFILPGSSTPWSPDGPAVPFWGPIWAVLGVGPGQSGTALPGTVGIFRTK